MNRREMLATLPGAAAVVAAAPSTPVAAAPASASLGLTGFDHMSINVMDFDKAVEWYRQALGLAVDVSWKVAALGDKQLAYLTLNGRRVIEIVAADANGTGLRAATTFAQHFGRTGYGHLCFATDNVDKTMAALAARGVPAFVKAETYPLDGTVFERRVAFISDPEGNVIEFGEPLRKRG
jgi:catechol 2,3-dioxygenase-like lactoylglutathione lyase family enzyme